MKKHNFSFVSGTYYDSEDVDAEIKLLRDALWMMFERHTNGDECYDEGGVYIGNAVELSSEEIENIIALSGKGGDSV